MLTKVQQDHFDEVAARIGTPSAALQVEIDHLRAAKSEGEVVSILISPANSIRSKLETEYLCLVAITKQLELNQCCKEGNFEVTNTTVLKNEPTQLKSNYRELFNLAKGIGIVALIFYIVISLLSKKHTGNAIEYTIVYTTINGQYLEKEASPDDLKSDFVLFDGGKRVSWADVQTKKLTVYPDELGIK